MLGNIDTVTNTPVITVKVNGRALFCTIDTGYNGHIWTDFLIARDVLNADIMWFGRKNWIPIHVISQPRVQRTQALIGTALLLGHVLVADFNHGIVEIIDPANPPK